MSEEKSGRSDGAKKTMASNEVNFEQMSIQEGSSVEIKGIDANRYATKKTVAQGLLDIALLTSNASQLKYILQVGSKHEFYTLLITLITISIVLQLLVGLLFVIIGGMDLDNHLDQPSAVILNDVSAGILALISSFLNADIHKKIMNWLNQISVGLMTGVIFCDVIKMNFGLDPALSEHDHFKNISVLSSIGSVILGFIFDINHQPHHRRAEIGNNLYLGTKTISTVVNVMISVFYSLDVPGNGVPYPTTATLNAI